MTTWQPASFPVLVGYDDHTTSRREVDGHTWELWGVHETACVSKDDCRHWLVTHLPTGRAVGAFSGRLLAQGYAEEITPLWDGWVGVRGVNEVPPRVLRKVVRVRVLWGGS